MGIGEIFNFFGETEEILKITDKCDEFSEKRSFMASDGERTAEKMTWRG